MSDNEAVVAMMSMVVVAWVGVFAYWLRHRRLMLELQLKKDQQSNPKETVDSPKVVEELKALQQKLVQ